MGKIKGWYKSINIYKDKREVYINTFDNDIWVGIARNHVVDYPKWLFVKSTGGDFGFDTLKNAKKYMMKYMKKHLRG